jgi:hypothetical protein|tara:strand:- start:2760 stop:3113 length:354 start_codon:yes stop_codon:yes gene_type:complete
MILEDVQNTSDMINENKYFIGIMMIMVNIGSRFIIEELSDEQRKFVNNPYFRRLVIFSVIFMATRDVIISFIVTAFILIFLYAGYDEYRPDTAPRDSNVKSQLDKAIDILKVSKESF